MILHIKAKDLPLEIHLRSLTALSYVNLALLQCDSGACRFSDLATLEEFPTS